MKPLDFIYLGGGTPCTILFSVMGVQKLGQYFHGVGPPTPERTWGGGRGTPWSPYPIPMVPRFVKNGQNRPKIGKNRPRENRIWATFSWGGVGVAPCPQGYKKKKRNLGHFLQGKNRNWAKIFRGVRSHPTPWGPKLALYTPRGSDLPYGMGGASFSKIGDIIVWEGDTFPKPCF